MNNEPIRVLHVVTHMNRGGLETMIMNYYRNIDRTKVQFDFLTHRPESEIKDYDNEIKMLGGRIYHLPTLNPFSMDYRRALDSFFKEHPEYTIVHSHLDCMSGIILKSAKKNNVKIRIAHCHSSNQDKDFKYVLKLIYKKSIKKYATQLLACGIEAGRWMFETTDFILFSNAIDAERFRYDVARRDRMKHELKLENAFVIGHVGRFSKVKNQELLVKVFKYIHENFEGNIKVVFVGEGPLRSSVEAYAKECGVFEDILFMGLRADIDDLMQAFDVFVMPSLYEGLPVSLVEAQASGLPCVISDKVPLDCKITDAVEQVSLKSGEKRWADAIMSFKGEKRIDNYSLIQSVGFDIKENARKLERFYLKCIG